MFFLALAMVGCTGNRVAQKTQQKGLANAAVPPDSSRIVVIPNPYVDDLSLANQAVQESQQELIKRGYKLVSSEAEADLVAIPTVETNSSVRLITSVKPVDIVETPTPGDAQVDRTGTVANSLGSLGSLSLSPSNGASVSGSGKPLLVIEAFRKSAWDKALIVNELQLQPVWKVKVALPASLKPASEGTAIAGRGDTDFELPR